MSAPATNAALTVLARDYLERFPAEAAAELEQATDEEAIGCLTELDAPAGAAILETLTPVTAERLLTKLTSARAAPLLGALEPSRAAALLARLAPETRAAHLSHLQPRQAKEIGDLTAYPPDTAGSLMDPRVMAFHPQMKVSEVLEQLRLLPQKKAVEVFLVDPQGGLVGAVPLQSLAIAAPEQAMQELLGPPPIAVQATSGREEVTQALTGERMASVVVVDIDGRLLGVIRRDALIQAAREEATAGALAMVGASKDERALSPASFAVRKRLPWLVINLGTAFVAASVVGLFESTIAKFTALAVLLPVVAGQSGNTGAQALAVTMRGLALREVRVSHAYRVALKELRVAFINGLAIAVVTAAAVYLWNRSFGLTLVIGVSMVLSMMAAGLAGATIPMVLTALRQDPAQSSSIVLTTVTDVVGFFSFLGIATLMASML